jgi:phage internal scaffolding protein
MEKFKPRTLKAHNGYDTKEASDTAGVITDWGPSLTIQSQAEDADLNIIMRRFGITGKMPENVRLPEYGDFTQITDYRSALESVRMANEAFMEIPAEIRARFQNDPQQFLEFTTNEKNLDELRKMGLAKPLQPTITPPPATPGPPEKVETKVTT